MIAGVIGLGAIGGGVARSLIAAGLGVVGHDPDERATARFVEVGAVAGSPAELAKGCDVVVVCVVNAAQTEAALFGPGGAVETARPGSTFLLCATIAPDAAEAFAARLASAGIAAIDAPVSGGAARAAAGELTLMASGAPEAFERASPVIAAMSSRLFRLGDAPGAASRMKLVNQHLAGIHIAAAAEALVQAIALGLDPHEVIDVIRHCAGSSWMFENRGPHIADGDYTPLSAVDIFVKDLGLVLDTASRTGTSPSLARAAHALFAEASAAGYGREDDAAVARVIAARAGVRLPGDAP